MSLKSYNVVLQILNSQYKCSRAVEVSPKTEAQQRIRNCAIVSSIVKVAIDKEHI